ncbi:MAG: hypothetical protein MZV64_59140 [Ignavibacteriales bacterium]|nr:hypothetical protein [Ignavibacteriales bacterium]
MKAIPGIGRFIAGSEGENRTMETLTNPEQTAIDLAEFLLALQRIDS